MPTPRRKSTTSKSKATTPASMPPEQKTIYNKLKRKGMTEKQALAFSKHAHGRKVAAAKKRETSASSSKSKPASKSRPRTTKKTTKNGKR